MNVRNALAIFGIINGLAVATAPASTALPYADSFDGSFPGSHWTVAGGGTATPASSAAHSVAAGANGLVLSNDTVTLEVNNGTYNNAWIQIYAKPVKGSADPSVSGVSGAFYITSAGQLKAYIAPSTWTNIGGATQFSANTYYGFIVHADYATDTWDIYSTSGAFKSAMTLLNTAGSLPFAVVGTQLDNVSVDSGDKAFLDAVAVSKSYTTAGATGDRVAVYEHGATASTLRDFTLPAYAAAYTNPVGNKALGSVLGNSILSGLVDGDALQVWNPANGLFETYEITSGDFEVTPAPASPNLITKATHYVYSNTRMLLDQNDTRSQTFGFYPYANATVVAESGVASPGAAGTSEPVTLNGTTINTHGFTALNWTDADTFANIEIEDPLADLTGSDKMYVAPPTEPNKFKEYWWDEAGVWRDFNNNIASAPIVAGSKIWVKRQAGGNSTITVVH